MSTPATVTSAPHHTCVVPQPKYKSAMGLAVQAALRAQLNPPKTNLEHNLTPHCDTCGKLLNRDGMQLFCFTCRVATKAASPSRGTHTTSFDPSSDPDYITHASYAAFCESVGAQPHKIERWNTSREVDKRVAYKLTDIKFPINTYAPYPLTLTKHLVRAAKCFRLFRDDLKTPRNVEQSFGFGYDEATRQLRITPECVHSELYDPKAILPRGESLHASSCQTSKGAPFCTCDGKKLPLASCWCDRCEEYVEQFTECDGKWFEHIHQKSSIEWKRLVAHLEDVWSYRATVKAHVLERVSGEQLRRFKTYDPAEYGTPVWPETPQKAQADWQRELATWPRFVPYEGQLDSHFCPHHWWDARYCTACACDCGEPKPYRDYLASLNCDPWACTHPNLRPFTFSTGETIKMCPDCTKFDGVRQNVLRTVNEEIVAYPTPGALALFNARLDAEGLSMMRGFSKKLVYRGTPIELEKCGVSKEEEESFGNGRVNTSGITGTNREGGQGRDFNERDRRGKQMLDAESDHEPLTECFDPYSGEVFWERAGTTHRPGTSHRQRFHEEWPNIQVDLHALRLKYTLLILKKLQEETKQ